MRFIVPCRNRLPVDALERAYLCGIEGIPWRSRTTWLSSGEGDERGEFVLDRAVDESGNLYVPWHVDGFGELVLSTASLMERREAYHLSVELARGLVNQLRSQAADWLLLGLQLPPEVEARMREATRCFADSVTAADESSAVDRAERAIEVGVLAAEMLMQEYSRQALAVRHQQAAQLPTMQAVTIDAEPISDAMSNDLLPAMNTASVALRWGDVEQVAGKLEWQAYDQQIDWCRAQGLRVIGGPLLQLTPQSMPDWLYLWEEDFDQVQAFVGNYVESAVKRYQGKVQIWNCAAGMNVRSHLTLTEEQKLRLVVCAIDEIRRGDSATPMIISFDQPWGEYLAFEEVDLSPIHFADSLVRAELGVAGIGLEINLGYWPRGTLPRNRLEISRMLDRWSVLNLPLIVFLTVPSGSAGDNGAAKTRHPVGAGKHQPSVDRQKEWVEQLVPVLMAKSFVQGIVWNQLTDAGRAEYPCGGLFDERLQAKPALKVLAELRKLHLT